MARKSNTPFEPPKPPELVLPRQEAFSKIQAQIDKGNDLTKVESERDFEFKKFEKSKWSSYNSELLMRLFTTQAVRDEYENYVGVVFVDGRRETMDERVANFQKEIREDINRLEAIRDRLDLIPEQVGVVKNPASKPLEYGNGVFIVHGHDDAAKSEVARFIEKQGLKAVILSEQANNGKTLIEKFEGNSNPEDIGFAIVLLTPDDVGAPKSAPDSLKSRARQNVVLELGYFMGKLGRRRVCALTKGHVEIPSDFMGVVYINMDNGSWMFEVAKEMRSLGMPIDMNKI